MRKSIFNLAIVSFVTLTLAGCGEDKASSSTTTKGAIDTASVSAQLTDEQIKDIVRRSYQYVAMYNVNNKFAMKNSGWNKCVADTQLKDETTREIARPNNDTLYISCMLDLRQDPVILVIPAFDSKYASLMATGYDHYVNVPMSVTKGDFGKPEQVLFYTSRTEGFDGGKVEGVDRNIEMTGDFVSAVFRVMPHATDKARFEKIIGQMQSVKAVTLSELQGKPAKPIDDVQFPSVGKTDPDVYENNFLEVMQFVVNHTSFDPNNEVEKGFLAAMQSIGIEPGKAFDKSKVANIDGKRFRAIAEQIQKTEFARAMDPVITAKLGMGMFKTRGNISLETLLIQSVLGPIGLPATEALYPPVTTTDGKPMNALHDYVIRMSKAELPPAGIFWSLTLYDSDNGFFIPNKYKKYSVGENAGMKLNKQGGIEVYIAAQKPNGVPEENWLPINRKDENLDVILRLYKPDFEKYKTWSAPKAERIK
jgi:hypothetical protein